MTYYTISTNTTADTAGSAWDCNNTSSWAGHSCWDSGTTSANITNNTIYYRLISNSEYLECEPQQITWTPPPETEEQKQARLEREAQQKREREEAQKRRDLARQKAEELLKEHIGLEAFGKLHEIGYLEMDSCKYQGRKYRVPKYARGSLDIVENGKVIDRLCVHPGQRFEDGDEILARIVMLEVNEDEILQIANHSPVRV